MSDPSLTSPEYNGYQVEIFTALFVPLQVFCVALRYYSRSITGAKLGVDDVLVGISLCFQMAMAGVAVSAVHAGCVGYHVGFLEETDPEKLIVFFKYLVAISSMYLVQVNIPKLAILALYWRLFPVAGVRWAIYATGAILIAATIANTTADLAACDPFEAQWAPPDVQATKCIDKEALFIWSSMPSIITDVVLLVLPMPVVWKLHATPRMKIALSFTFIVGSFGLVTSILRFTTFFANNSFIDATFTATELIIWTETEPGIYLICACLPTYRPLLERIGITRMTRGTTRGTSKNTGSDSAGRRRWYGLGYLKPTSGSSGFHELQDRSEVNTGNSDAPKSTQPQSMITVTTDIQSQSQWGKPIDSNV